MVIDAQSDTQLKKLTDEIEQENQFITQTDQVFCQFIPPGHPKYNRQK